MNSEVLVKIRSYPTDSDAKVWLNQESIIALAKNSALRLLVDMDDLYDQIPEMPVTKIEGRDFVIVDDKIYRLKKD